VRIPICEGLARDGLTLGVAVDLCKLHLMHEPLARFERTVGGLPWRAADSCRTLGIFAGAVSVASHAVTSSEAGCRSAVTDAALRAATDLRPWGSWSCRLWLDNAEGRPGYRRGLCAFAKCARACEMAPPGAELRNRPPRVCSSHPDARYSIESVQPSITT
jgi:hypothetical protein